MSGYLWFSFAEPDRSLGVVILPAPDFELDDNMLVVTLGMLGALGVNPGGEALVFQLPEEALADDAWALANTHRLLSPAELAEHGYGPVDDA